MREIEHHNANLYLFNLLKKWGLEEFINYGVRLGFFEDNEDGIDAINEDMIPVLLHYEIYDEVDWLKIEIEKYIAG